MFCVFVLEIGERMTHKHVQGQKTRNRCFKNYFFENVNINIFYTNYTFWKEKVLDLSGYFLFVVFRFVKLMRTCKKAKNLNVFLFLELPSWNNIRRHRIYECVSGGRYFAILFRFYFTSELIIKKWKIWPSGAFGTAFDSYQADFHTSTW